MGCSAPSAFADIIKKYKSKISLYHRLRASLFDFVTFSTGVIHRVIHIYVGYSVENPVEKVLTSWYIPLVLYRVYIYIYIYIYPYIKHSSLLVCFIGLLLRCGSTGHRSSPNGDLRCPCSMQLFEYNVMRIRTILSNFLFFFIFLTAFIVVRFARLRVA